MQNPWRTLDSTIVYDNPWIQVTHRNVLNPNGNPGIYGMVHFKHLAIAVVPIDEEGHTWLVGQYRYTLEQYSWEVPEGGGKLNDQPLASAQRELLEETGITAAEWVEIGELHTSNSVTDERGLIFAAKGLSFGQAEPEDTEQLQVRRLPLDEAVGMVLRNEITDGLAQVALLKAKLLRDAGKI